MRKIIIFVLCLALFVPGIAMASNDGTAADYVESIRARFNNVGETYNLSYSVSPVIEENYMEAGYVRNKKVYDEYFAYDFDIDFPGNTLYQPYIYFFANSASPEDKSFHITCYNDDISPAQIKELILATCMVIDDTISYDEAQDVMQKLVVSYDGKNHSDLYSTDDYTLFILPGKGYDDEIQTQIIAFDNSQMPVVNDEKKQRYPEASAREIYAPLNALENVCFKGTPIQKMNDYSSDWTDAGSEFWHIELSSSDSYVVGKLSFAYMPVILDNAEYMFYGTIIGGEHAGTGLVRIDYVEKVD